MDFSTAKSDVDFFFFQANPKGFVGELSSNAENKRRQYDESVQVMRAMASQLQHMRQLFNGATATENGHNEVEDVEMEEEEEEEETKSTLKVLW